MAQVGNLQEKFDRVSALALSQPQIIYADASSSNARARVAGKQDWGRI